MGFRGSRSTIRITTHYLQLIPNHRSWPSLRETALFQVVTRKGHKSYLIPEQCTVGKQSCWGGGPRLPSADSPPNCCPAPVSSRGVSPGPQATTAGSHQLPPQSDKWRPLAQPLSPFLPSSQHCCSGLYREVERKGANKMS